MENSGSNTQRNPDTPSSDVLTEIRQWLEELASMLQDRINLIQEQIDSNETDTSQRDQILVVRIRGGAPILRESQAQAFGFVIEVLGIEAVRALGKTIGNDPLISTSRSPNPNIRYYPSGPYYIKTTMNCDQKKDLLEEIASELRPSVHIQVDIYQKRRT